MSGEQDRGQCDAGERRKERGGGEPEEREGGAAAARERASLAPPHIPPCFTQRTPWSTKLQTSSYPPFPSPPTPSNPMSNPRRQTGVAPFVPPTSNSSSSSCGLYFVPRGKTQPLYRPAALRRSSPAPNRPAATRPAAPSPPHSPAVDLVEAKSSWLGSLPWSPAAGGEFRFDVQSTGVAQGTMLPKNLWRFVAALSHPPPPSPRRRGSRADNL